MKIKKRDLEKYYSVFKKNKLWAADKLESDANFFKKLAKEQNPDFLFIGCSDSRVSADAITGLDAGELFVHRNIGNMVVSADVNIMSVMQYAIEELGVKHIVVCGHYGCGGVHAALTTKEYGLLDNWLRNIRDVYRLHKKELNSIENEKVRCNRLVELNIREQCVNVIKTSYYQKSFKQTGYPSVHGWVYDITNGILEDLNIDFENIYKEIQDIYRIQS